MIGSKGYVDGLIRLNLTKSKKDKRFSDYRKILNIHKNRKDARVKQEKSGTSIVGMKSIDNCWTAKSEGIFLIIY